MRRTVRARPARRTSARAAAGRSSRATTRAPLDRDPSAARAAHDLALARDDARRRSRERRRRSAKAARRCCAPSASARPPDSPISGSRTRAEIPPAPSRRADSPRPSRARKSSATTKIALPTAGNAGGAAAAYAAKAGMECHVFMPRDTPPLFRLECERYGAHVTLVDGLIDACGRIVARARAARRLARRLDAQGAVPRRGQEDDGLRARRGLRLGAAGRDRLSDRRRHGPDRHVEGLRRDGGAGLDRAEAPAHDLGPGGRAARRSRRLSPKGETSREKWENASTYASGLRVPEGLRGLPDPARLRASGGDAVAVTDDEMRAAEREIGAAEGLFVAPEGGAAWAAAKRLAREGRLDARAGSSSSTRGPASSTDSPHQSGAGPARTLGV